MQIKATMRYHFTPTKMAIIKNKQVTSVGEDMEKVKTLYIAGGNIKWCCCCGKQQFLSMLNIKSPHEPAIPLLVTYPRELKTGGQKETCT